MAPCGASSSTDRSSRGDAVVIAMGPWSVLASRWLPLPAVYGLKGHSLVFRYCAGARCPTRSSWSSRPRGGTIASPEVMPRPDGTTYVCGLSSEQPLPVDPAAVAPDEGGCDRLRAMTAQFLAGARRCRGAGRAGLLPPRRRGRGCRSSAPSPARKVPTWRRPTRCGGMLNAPGHRRGGRGADRGR